MLNRPAAATNPSCLGTKARKAGQDDSRLCNRGLGPYWETMSDQRGSWERMEGVIGDTPASSRI